jgi:hypothetical protein
MSRLNGPPEQERMRGDRTETWEERWPRYANNAQITARYAHEYADRAKKAAAMHEGAAANARRHGDIIGADLYDEMAKAALDSADANEDLADLARQVAAHYTTTLEDQTDG